MSKWTYRWMDGRKSCYSLNLAPIGVPGADVHRVAGTDEAARDGPPVVTGTQHSDHLQGHKLLVLLGIVTSWFTLPWQIYHFPFRSLMIIG